MARLYANENFPLPAVEQLRKLGHDVLTVQETGKGGQRFPDGDVLAFAREENRAVLTINRRHFIQLHGQVVDHPGIIVCSFDPDFAALAGRIDRAIGSQPSLYARLIRIDRPDR